MATAIFDSHLHILDPAFPLVSNQGYLPEAFTVERYQQKVKSLDVRGGAVVSGSFQAYDQCYLLNALSELGEGFVGVTQLPVTVSDEKLLALNHHRVRALRFNLKRGGSESVEHLKVFAQRVYDLVGWHVELYVDSSALSVELVNTISSLPAVSIDHLGLSKTGLPTLLSLVKRGVRIKATGFSRLNFDPRAALESIYRLNPKALMFGTDLPSTRAPREFERADLDLLYDVLGLDGIKQVCWQNAREFYGFE